MANESICRAELAEHHQEQADIDRRLAARLRSLAGLAARLSDIDSAACASGAAALEYRADVYERRAKRARARLRAQQLAPEHG
jgi:hypothetical protein